MLPVFKRLLQYDQSREVVVDTAWALSYASDAVNDAIDDILASGCLPLLLRLLSSNLVGRFLHLFEISSQTLFPLLSEPLEIW